MSAARRDSRTANPTSKMHGVTGWQSACRLSGESRVWQTALGIGGTIPFMSMLGERFPEAQFLITGVLGPHSNAHGPNEFLHLPTARKITDFRRR